MAERLPDLAALALCAGLAACAGGGASVPLPTAAPRPAQEAFRPPPAASGGGAGELIGADAAALRSRFGEPRIDLAEGDARKLQFAGEACVLDIYLYPARAGAAPAAAHVEARLRQGGTDIPQGACIAEIERTR